MRNSQTIQNEMNALQFQRDELNNSIGFLEKELVQALKDESGLKSNFVDDFIEKANAGRENLPNPFTGGKGNDKQ